MRRHSRSRPSGVSGQHCRLFRFSVGSRITVHLRPPGEWVVCKLHTRLEASIMGGYCQQGPWAIHLDRVQAAIFRPPTPAGRPIILRGDVNHDGEAGTTELWLSDADGALYWAVAMRYRLGPSARIRPSRYKSSTRGMTNTNPHQRPVAQSTKTMTAIQTAKNSRSAIEDFRCRRSQIVT